MDTNIALIASGYLLARFGLFIVFAYIVYRVLRSNSNTTASPSLATSQKRTSDRGALGVKEYVTAGIPLPAPRSQPPTGCGK